MGRVLLILGDIEMNLGGSDAKDTKGDSRQDPEYRNRETRGWRGLWVPTEEMGSSQAMWDHRKKLLSRGVI